MNGGLVREHMPPGAVEGSDEEHVGGRGREKGHAQRSEGRGPEGQRGKSGVCRLAGDRSSPRRRVALLPPAPTPREDFDVHTTSVRNQGLFPLNRCTRWSDRAPLFPPRCRAAKSAFQSRRLVSWDVSVLRGVRIDPLEEGKKRAVQRARSGNTDIACLKSVRFASSVAHRRRMLPVRRPEPFS
jgi:hypothetical protein